MNVQVPGTNALESAYSRFYLDESGQDLIEYALLAALVACGSIAGTRSLALSVANSLGGIQNALNNAIPPQSSTGGSSGSGSGGGNNNGGGGNRGGGHGGGRGGGGGRGHHG
jgi:Flp pilus assembly pilin Flp